MAKRKRTKGHIIQWLKEKGQTLKTGGEPGSVNSSCVSCDTLVHVINNSLWTKQKIPKDIKTSWINNERQGVDENYK
jgi:hypothetical protein